MTSRQVSRMLLCTSRVKDGVFDFGRFRRIKAGGCCGRGVHNIYVAPLYRWKYSYVYTLLT
jgi:hypothetical protein